MPTTDRHAACRDAIVTAFSAAMVAEGYPASGAGAVPVVAVDDIEEATKGNSLPVVVVAAVGPEQDRPDWGSNQQDGLAYPVSVALLATGVVGGAKGIPALTPTLFLRLLRVTFHNKRLSGVSQVGLCEVSTAPVLFDPNTPNFNRIQTVGTVVCVGRWPRS